jgi:hypothetical protein
MARLDIRYDRGCLGTPELLQVNGGDGYNIVDGVA